MKRVTIIGAECTGKTSLVRALSERLSVPWVPEAARVFVERSSRPVREGDEDVIADLHLVMRRAVETSARDVGMILLDTDLLATVVYARHYQGRCPDRLVRRAAEHRADLYLLTLPDIPWQDEPSQRGSRADRTAVHRSMLASLRRRSWPFRAIGGSPDTRLQASLVAIAGLSEVWSPINPD